MPKYAANEAVRVVGLDEFRAELRKLEGNMGRELGKAHKAAAEVVASKARSRAASLGGAAAKSAPSIKASAAARHAAVNVGGPSHPWAMGAEFGAIRWRQFEPWRGNQWQPDVAGVGYFLHPAIRETREEFMDVYARELEQLARAAYPD